MKIILGKNNKIIINYEIKSLGIPNYKMWMPFLDIEGQLTILICDNIFFEETQFFTLCEFAYHLNQWLKLVKKNNQDFHYNPLDVDDDIDLFHFKYIEDKNSWKIFSSWQKFDSEILFDLDEIFNPFNQYVEKFIQELKQTYHLEITKILNDKVSNYCTFKLNSYQRRKILELHEIFADKIKPLY